MKKVEITYYEEKNTTNSNLKCLINSDLNCCTCHIIDRGNTTLLNKLSVSGIYILVGVNPITKVYIGKSKNILRRINEHNRNTEFWSRCIIFTNKQRGMMFNDDELNFIESTLISEVVKNGNLKLLSNYQMPVCSVKVDKKHEFLYTRYIDDIKFYLSIFNIPLYYRLQSDTEQINSVYDNINNPYVHNKKTILDRMNHYHNIAYESNKDEEFSENKLYRYTDLQVDVRGTYTNELHTHFMIYKGSRVHITDRNRQYYSADKDFIKTTIFKKSEFSYILPNYKIVDVSEDTGMTLLYTIISGQIGDNLKDWSYKILD